MTFTFTDYTYSGLLSILAFPCMALAILSSSSLSPAYTHSTTPHALPTVSHPKPSTRYSRPSS